MSWHHVRTAENPADLRSRSGKVVGQDLWWNGPTWLSDRESRPPDIITSASAESKAEAKATREIFAGAITTHDDLDVLLEKLNYWEAFRRYAWIMRFTNNAHKKKTSRTTGPLTTAEINQVKLFWEKRVQERAKGDGRYHEDQLQLNLQPNSEGVLECHGRIQGHYPIYLPDSQLYTEKLAEHYHLSTLHGGVGLTMAKVWEFYFVPRLRKLVKRVNSACYKCRRYQAKYQVPHQETYPGTEWRVKHHSKS